MRRLYRAARDGVFQEPETWLWSLGIALVLLSVLMVPANRALADDGSSSPLAAVCGTNGFNCDNGCRTSPPLYGGMCGPAPVVCLIGNPNCLNCGCTWCRLNFGNCQCSCQLTQRRCVNQGGIASCPTP
jgi:hypothetical protein